MLKKNKKIIKILSCQKEFMRNRDFLNLALYIPKLKNVHVIWRNHPSIKNNKLLNLEKNLQILN